MNYNNNMNQKSNIVNQIYENDIYTDEPFYEKRKQEFMITDEYLHRKKYAIQEFKKLIEEHKDEYIQTFQLILQKYGKEFESNPNQIDEMDIYKNFIYVMVLLLNEDEQIRFLYKNVLKSNLQLDSFYAPFSKEIEQYSQRNSNRDILFFDIDMNTIQKNDKRLLSHMIVFYEYFKIDTFHYYFSNLSNQNQNKLNIEINIQQRKINIKLPEIKMNIFEYINYFIQKITKTDSLNLLYYDNIEFIKQFTQNENMHTYKIFSLLQKILRNITAINEEKILKERTSVYILGDRYLGDNSNINIFMLNNIFSMGHVNILKTYILSPKINNIYIEIIDLLTSYRSIINDLDTNRKYSNEIFSYDSLFRISDEHNIFVKNIFDKLEKNKKYKISNDLNQITNKINISLKTEGSNILNFQNYFQTYSWKLKFILNRYDSILQKLNPMNYFSYFQSIQIIPIGRYFNLLQYPIFYHFKIPINENIIIQPEILHSQYVQLFENLKKPEIFYFKKIKLFQYIYFLCKMNDEIHKNKTKSFEIIFEEQKQNILERQEISFLQQFLTQTQQTNDIQQLNSFIDSSILEPIQQFLEKKYEYFDLCLFYYSFFNYMNLYEVSISLHNNISKRIRNLNNQTKIQSIDNIVKYMMIDYMGYLRPQTKEILKKKWIEENENMIYQNMQKLYNYNFKKIKEGKLNINEQNKTHPDYGNLFSINQLGGEKLKIGNWSNLGRLDAWKKWRRSNWKEVSKENKQKEISSELREYQALEKYVTETEKQLKEHKSILNQKYGTSNMNQLKKIYESQKKKDANLQEILQIQQTLKQRKNKLKFYQHELQFQQNDEKLKKIFILHEDISIKKINQKILKDIYQFWLQNNPTIFQLQF